MVRSSKDKREPVTLIWHDRGARKLKADTLKVV